MRKPFFLLSILIALPFSLLAQTSFTPPSSWSSPQYSPSVASGELFDRSAYRSAGFAVLAASCSPSSPFSSYLSSRWSPQQQASDAAAPEAAPPNPKKSQPIGSMSFGYDFLRTDLTNKKGPSATLMGWYVIPQVNLNKHLGLFADFTNFYGVTSAPHENIHGFTGGPIFMFPVNKKLIPYVFVEGGAVRVSAKSKINWDTTAIGGAGFNYGLTRQLALQVLPLEYIATQQSGTWVSNYGAQVGISLNLFGNR